MAEFGVIAFVIWEIVIIIWIWKGKTFQKSRKNSLVVIVSAFLFQFIFALILAAMPSKVAFPIRYKGMLLFSIVFIGAIFPISYTMYFFGPKIGEEKYIIAGCIFWYAGIAIQQLTDLISAFSISLLCAVIYLQNRYFNELYIKK